MRIIINNNTIDGTNKSSVAIVGNLIQVRFVPSACLHARKEFKEGISRCSGKQELLRGLVHTQTRVQAACHEEGRIAITTKVFIVFHRVRSGF